MTPTRKRASGDDQHAVALDLVDRVAAELRTRQAHATDLGDVAHAAIQANSAAHAELNAAITVYRNLIAALANGAGYERPPSLRDAIEDARAFLGVTPQ